jgi:hypothetical protein
MFVHLMWSDTATWLGVGLLVILCIAALAASVVTYNVELADVLSKARVAKPRSGRPAAPKRASSRSRKAGNHQDPASKRPSKPAEDSADKSDVF